MVLRSGCVLVVDDEPDLCHTLTAVLQIQGYRVLTCTDGLEALEHLRGGVHPCLILLDMMMPRMNGEEFREEQMRDSALCEIPIFVITGGGEAVLRRVAALGLEVLTKPIQLETLLEVVERFCRPVAEA